MSTKLHFAAPLLTVCNFLPPWPKQPAAQSAAPRPPRGKLRMSRGFMRQLGVAVRTCCSGLFLLTGVAAFAAQVNVICANTSGDAVKLNTAIENSHSGDRIQIHGICQLNASIILLGARTYAGDSRTGTILRQASGANLPALLASDSWNEDWTYTGDPVRVADLTLDGNSAANSTTNALVIRSWLTVIEDIQVENAPADGIQITSLSKNGVALQGSQVNGHISNVFVTNSGSVGIHVVDPGNSVTDWSLLDSWVAYSGQSAIYMDNAAGWTVRGNHVYGIQQHAIFANSCWATSIDENYIEDFGGSGGSNTWYGIACTVGGGAASGINGNKVFMFAKEPANGDYVFIGVPQVNYGAGIINVVGNTILGANGRHDTGLSYLLNGGTDLKVLSSNNNVQGVHTARSVGAGVKLVDGY
ncbi:MAG: right-handed parallel beta-helix repeat-containing protein [Terriglobales bacterium]